MKILFLSRLYYPHIGGVEKHVESLAAELLKRGHCVSLITEMFNKNLRPRDSINNLEVFRISYTKTRFLGLLCVWYFLFKNRSLLQNSDVIHCHDVFIWYLPFRFLYPKKPVYTTFHGWEGIYPIPIKNILIRKVANRLSFATLGVGRYLEKYYRINLSEVTYGAAKIENRHRFKKLRKRIIYVGRLEKDTGLQTLLKTLTYLKNYKIDFYGDGQLSVVCKKFGEVHGFKRRVPYEKFSVCFSSGYLTALEGMANKCLIIACYDNLLKEAYWKDTPFSKWIIIQKDPKRTGEEIEYYMRNPGRRKLWIDSAYRWVENQTWKNMVDLYLRLWRVE